MRLPLLIATCFLTPLTATVLVGAWITIRPVGLPAEATTTNDAANRAVVIAFYAAANTVIATGDASSLDPLLASDFREVDTEDRETDPPTTGRNGLVARLQTIHAVAPTTRIAVNALAADGDLVVAQVQVPAVKHPSFLGLPVNGNLGSAWGTVDVFRLADAQIIEYRGGTDAFALLAVNNEIPLEDPIDGRSLRVVSSVIAPGAHHDAPVGSGRRFAVVIAGAVVVEGATPGLAATPLTVGDSLSFAKATAYTIRNTGSVPAEILDISIFPPANYYAVVTAPPLVAEEDVLTRYLANDLVISAPDTPVLLAIGRVTLAPGARLAWSGGPGSVLLSVESGAAALQVDGSVPWITAAERDRSDAGVVAELHAGHGALLEPSAAAEIVAAPGKPTTMLIITLMPTADAMPETG